MDTSEGLLLEGVPKVPDKGHWRPEPVLESQRTESGGVGDSGKA